MKNGTKQAFVFPETGKRKVTFHLQTATNHKEVEIREGMSTIHGG